MTEYFSKLSEADFTKLKDAIPLITLLIGAADGDLDKNEKDWAQKVTKIRSYNFTADLTGFYKEVGVDFSDKLDHFVEVLPTDTETRTLMISDRLSALSGILEQLDPTVAFHLYRSYLSFAKHVAKASGGLFGFFAIGPDEKALLGLPMLKPIPEPEGWEEE